MKILALDVSLTSTGWALWAPGDGEALAVGAIRTKTRGLDRYREILAALDELYADRGAEIAVVVFEGYPYFLFGQQKGPEIKDVDDATMASGRTLNIGGKFFKRKLFRTDAGHGPGNQVFGLAGITEMIKMKIHFQWRLPFACIAPTSIKKYATDYGRANKAMMISQLWKEHQLRFRTDDEVDAWYIGQLASDVWLTACEADIDNILPHRREVVRSILRTNNPEGTFDWRTLDWFDKLFGRKKLFKKRKRGRHGRRKGNRDGEVA